MLNQVLKFLGFAEDSAHTTGDEGVLSLAVRKDSFGTSVSASGDYSALLTDENGNLKSATPEEAVRVDDVGGGVTYIGQAAPGTATSAAAWSIKRWTVVGDDHTIEFADGDNLQDNIWDNRVSLSYS